MAQTQIVLNKVIDEIQTDLLQKQKVRVVFDLDSTLFNVAPRFSRIIKDFCHESTMQKKYPKAIEKLSQVEIQSHPYYLKTFMKQIGLEDQSPDFYKEVFEYWKTRFFHNDYVIFDEPEQGAVEFVRYLYQKNVHIIYLTGRDEPRMKKGTLESLKKWNFPLDHSTAELILKPTPELEDSVFKRDYLKIFPQNEDVWFFENEPVNIHLVSQDCPHVKIIFFDSVHSGKAPAPKELPTIQHFCWNKKS